VDGKAPNIRSQNSAYRRGLVLGLTMAEIMVLILFTLLLALAAALAAKTKIITAANREIETQRDRMDHLAVMERQLGDLFRSRPEGVTVSDIIERLQRQESRIAGLQRQVEHLRPYEQNGKMVDDIVQEIKRRRGDDYVSAQQILDEMSKTAQLSKDNENLRGQVAQLSHQIKATGRGNEFPSCWVTADGKTQSIFELLVTENGVQIRDRYLPGRAEDKATLPLSAVRYDTEMPVGEFQSELRPLYRWSIDHQCRFYAVIFSVVEKAPIQTINAVNEYFYPDSLIQYRPGRL
jgi:TolA-binding protein